MNAATRESRLYSHNFLARLVEKLRERQGGQVREVGHLLASETDALLGAAEFVLAMRPATAEETDAIYTMAARDWGTAGDGTSREWGIACRVRDAVERRLLPWPGAAK